MHASTVAVMAERKQAQKRLVFSSWPFVRRVPRQIIGVNGPTTYIFTLRRNGRASCRFMAGIIDKHERIYGHRHLNELFDPKSGFAWSARWHTHHKPGEPALVALDLSNYTFDVWFVDRYYITLRKET